MKNNDSVSAFSFEKALPVWMFGRDREMNLWLSFRTVAKAAKHSVLRITGSAAYDIKINGRFIAFGPARSPHGYFRTDELDLSAELISEAVVCVTVAGYNANSYYHLDQPSFLCAELVQDGVITAATGHEGFLCRVLTEHEQKVQRYSVQRTFCEVWNVSGLTEIWETAPQIDAYAKAFSLITPVETESKKYIPRGSAYHHYPRIHPEALVSRLRFTGENFASRIRYPNYIVPRSPSDEICKRFTLSEMTTDSFLTARNIEVREILPANETPRAERIAAGEGLTYRMAFNTTGKIEMNVFCEEDAELVMTFDEFLGENGLVNFRRLYTVNALVWRLTKGSHRIATFEPYTLGAAHIFATKGSVEISEFSLIYFGADDTDRKYNGTDESLQKIFHAAVETYRQNTFTIFMDCPSRERAGWLCDSFFTARVEKVLTGKSEIEHSFLENFFIAEKTPILPNGMFPMCYPADHYNKNYISNWAMWLVIELEEYLARTGDQKLIDKAKTHIYALLDFFAKYENADGLLEKLDAWVFIEWSEANKLTQDISFPSNMLFAKMLDSVANLYGDDALREKASRLRAYIDTHAVTEDGFYCDNAVYDSNGIPKLSGKCTETCQYYAFFCGVATPESHPELWNRMVNDFGPERVLPGEWPALKPEAKWQHVYASNAFIGNYLRLELLYQHGEHEKLLSNIRSYFTKMAELTGTLWENETTTASCNHGFASHVLYWMDGLDLID